jgi:hypothetical protein
MHKTMIKSAYEQKRKQAKVTKMNLYIFRMHPKETITMYFMYTYNTMSL